MVSRIQKHLETHYLQRNEKDRPFDIALANTHSAGLPLSQVAGSNTSVFAGQFVHDYRDALLRDADNLPRLLITGVGDAMAANRISHFFDFRGASMTIETGCSTSLVALHQAVQGLRSGESEMSIVGGSNLILNADMFKVGGSLG
jgi:acyl transferase domain-containing protein